MVGLGAMMGAGVFAGLAPASALAGRWFLVAIVLAGAAAACGCCSSCDESGVYPGSGGGYRYTRELLGRGPGRMAGALYLVGGAAAAAAIASCFGAYVAPARPVPAALGALLVAVLADAYGVRFSRAVTRVLVIFVLGALAVVVAACFGIAPPPPTGVAPPAGAAGTDDPAALPAAAGVMFFAYLGFERVTAPGTDQPAASRRRLRVIIPVLLLAATGTYLVVALAVLHQLGPLRLAVSAAPLRDALDAADASALVPIATMAAMVATGCALLAVLGACRRTAEEMAGGGDLPVGERPGARRAAVTAVLGVGAAIGLLVADPTRLIELAGTCGLFYFAFTNSAARLLAREERSWPVRSSCFGLLLCVVLGMAMPAADLVIALGAVAVGALLGPAVAMVRSAGVRGR